jgi:hypothetical protein
MRCTGVPLSTLFSSLLSDPAYRPRFFSLSWEQLGVIAFRLSFALTSGIGFFRFLERISYWSRQELCLSFDSRRFKSSFERSKTSSWWCLGFIN